MLSFKKILQEKRYFGDGGAGAIIQAKDTGRILVVQRSFGGMEIQK